MSDTPRLPLSRRERPEDDHSDHVGPFEGVPAWLWPSIEEWVVDLLDASESPYYWAPTDLLARVERRLRLPLTGARYGERRDFLVTKMMLDDELALNVVDTLLGTIPTRNAGDPEATRILSEVVVKLITVLSDAGSAWRVALDDDAGVIGLARRAAPEQRAALDAVIDVGGRSADHLRRAWARTFARTPDAGSAYREAVRAVEAAAAPIIIPDDSLPTLGRAIAALRARPSKWSTRLHAEGGDDAVLAFAASMSLLWKGQFDRHGTADTTVPIDVSIEEAEDAVHLAVVLVHMLTTGGLVRTPGDVSA